MKVDLHVHSKLSTRPSVWFLQKIGCSESYTEPAELYRIAVERGMDAVTITDHNAIAGVLEIAHLPGVFTGCEVTTYFPEDNCKLHVLVYGIDEERFREIDKLRENVFDLVPYLQSQGIDHALAHPFYSVNDRLTVEHFEKSLLLFKCFELNGDQESCVNRDLRAVLSSLGPRDIEVLADRHDIWPDFPVPWQKTLIGGSDDHSALNTAYTYTEVAEAGTADEFWSGIRQGRSEVIHRKSATPLTMAHHLYGIAYQFYKHKLDLARGHEENLLMRFMERMLDSREHREPGLWKRLFFKFKNKPEPGPLPVRSGMADLFQVEAEKLIKNDPHLLAMLSASRKSDVSPDREWFDFVDKISNSFLANLSGHITSRLVSLNPFDLFHTLGGVGALSTLLAPYFIAYATYSKNKRFSKEARSRFSPPFNPGDGPKVAVFTDTFDEVNGVARTWKRNLALAEQTGKKLEVLTCPATPDKKTDIPGVSYFGPAHTYSLPIYPDQKIFIPPLLSMMNYCYEKGFTHIHGATPGPLGLCALAMARIMGLPFCTTYHTSIAQFAGYLTGDASIRDLVWRYTVWFYEQSDIIFSPSQASTDELVEKGISEEKIVRMPRGVDAHRFGPERRGDYELPEGTKLLYVGRVSKEKNLPLLCRAFKRLCMKRNNAQLVVVGDGPYLEKMKKEIKGHRSTFTGYLEGDDLAAAYASSDLFVFPSTSDTFGNVVLEAQASGLPVIVTDKGGPCENMVPDVTGVVVRGDSESALLEAMDNLLSKPARATAMGKNAVDYARTRSYEQAFDKYWNMYRQDQNNSGKEKTVKEKSADVA